MDTDHITTRQNTTRPTHFDRYAEYVDAVGSDPEMQIGFHEGFFGAWAPIHDNRDALVGSRFHRCMDGYINAVAKQVLDARTVLAQLEAAEARLAEATGEVEPF